MTLDEAMLDLERFVKVWRPIEPDLLVLAARIFRVLEELRLETGV